jgi:hypothetical protein
MENGKFLGNTIRHILNGWQFLKNDVRMGSYRYSVCTHKSKTKSFA